MGRPGLPIPFVSHETPLGVVPRGLPLAELWERFLSSGDVTRLSTSRQRSLKRTRDLSVSLPPHPEKHHVVQWLTNLLPGRKPGTVQLEKWNLQSLYSWAHGAGLAGYHPLHALRWRAPDAQRHAIRDIYEKWPLVLSCVRDEREAAFLGTMRFAGLRPAEAQGLYAECIEAWSGVWLINVRQQRSEHTLDVRPVLKSHASHRTLECRPELVELLRPVLAAERASVRTIVDRREQWGVTPLLFPYRAHDLKSLLIRLRRVLPDDFPADSGLHVFRHSFAVERYRWQRAESGACDVVELSKLLGHESVKYTQTYLRGLVGDDVVRNTLSRMSGAPPWARSPAAAVPVPGAGNAASTARAMPGPLSPVDASATQTAMLFGPMNVVKRSRGGAPPTEKSEAVTAATVTASDPSNPSFPVTKNRRTRKAVNP